jgi:hypothetical protein
MKPHVEQIKFQVFCIKAHKGHYSRYLHYLLKDAFS